MKRNDLGEIRAHGFQQYRSSSILWTGILSCSSSAKSMASVSNTNPLPATYHATTRQDTHRSVFLLFLH
jgi:hypothetical protein